MVLFFKGFYGIKNLYHKLKEAIKIFRPVIYLLSKIFSTEESGFFSQVFYDLKYKTNVRKDQIFYGENFEMISKI